MLHSLAEKADDSNKIILLPRQKSKDLSFYAWDQFRDDAGQPTLPQRANVMGYTFTGTGTVQNGNIQCKTIVVQSLMDESTCPWCADWYRGKVREAKGSEQDFRVYYMDRCIEEGLSAATAEAEYTFDTPGVYYASARIKANRNGDAADLFTQVKNIARAKIIVE